MLLHDLLRAVDVVDERDRAAVDVTDVTHDSRGVTPGALFACIPGARTDGHDHAAAAIAAGAVALLVERFVAVPRPVPQVRVRSVRAALGPVAARLQGAPSRSLRVLGVTGTNGKTTTTYLLESIARAAGERTGVIGTVEARIGDEVLPAIRTTPEAPELQALFARMRDQAVDMVALEVSSHALDQGRVDGTWFATATFTNLGRDHLDHHGSQDRYFEAKARLFSPERTTTAVVNHDDPFGRRIGARARERGLAVRSYGLDPDADVHAVAVETGAGGTRFGLAVDGASPRPVATPLLGSFNVENALAAAATALAAGYALDAVVAGLAHPRPVPGRMERIGSDPGRTVLVDYAHTPDALDRVLRAARDLAGDRARVHVAFGCGGDRDREKRPLMGAVAATRADVVIVTTDNPRSEDPEAIASEIVAGTSRGGHARVVVELDRRRAIRDLLAGAQPGDVVVVAGKGHEPGQQQGGVTTPFDDRDVVRHELEALGCA